MENQQHHQFLPNEIIIDILSRLSANSTIRFKRVCKAWRYIIEEDPVFQHMHVRRLIDDSSTASSSLSFVVLESVRQSSSSSSFIMNHYVRFAEYKHIEEVMNFKRWKLPFRDHYSSAIQMKNLNLAIVGSCNGLVCISTTHDYKPNHHHTFICNPWTGEVLDLSDSISNDHNVIVLEEYCLSSLILVGIGFGYLPSTNEYKVVRIYTSSDDTLFSDKRSIKHVQVHTLGSRSPREEEEGGRWRTIVPPISSSWSDISFSSPTRHENFHPVFGVSVNGALYFNNYEKNIVSFDLANEEFRIIVPPAAAAPDTNIDGLGVLGGSLCATKSRHLINPIPINDDDDDANTITDLWVMEKDNKDQEEEEEEEEESWIKKFSLPPVRYMMFPICGYIPLGALASPPRILLQSKGNKKIVSYNTETDETYCMDIPPGDWNTSSNYTLIPYVKSCVSLKALGENTAKKGNLIPDGQNIHYIFFFPKILPIPVQKQIMEVIMTRQPEEGL